MKRKTRVKIQKQSASPTDARGQLTSPFSAAFVTSVGSSTPGDGTSSIQVSRGDRRSLPGGASLSHLVELLALQVLEYVPQPSRLSLGFGASSFRWSSVIIWLNEEPRRVCGSSNEAAAALHWRQERAWGGCGTTPLVFEASIALGLSSPALGRLTHRFPPYL